MTTDRQRWKHGSRKTHKDRGCRCSVCVQAHEARKRDEAAYRRRKRAETIANGLPETVTHGLVGADYGCRCDVCKAAQSEKNARYQQANNEQYATANADSRKRADRHKQEWTGPELEIAARPDLTAKEAAAMLGRTVWAVHRARTRIREEPRTARLAGLPGRDEA